MRRVFAVFAMLVVLAVGFAFPMPAMAEGSQTEQMPFSFLGAEAYPGKTSFELAPVLPGGSLVDIEVKYYDADGNHLEGWNRHFQVAEGMGGMISSTTTEGAVTLDAFIQVTDPTGTATIGQQWLDQPVGQEPPTSPIRYVFCPTVLNQGMLGQ